MPSALPAGDPVPADGSLPAAALAELGERPFGLYVHVPFCTVRCGYCDFNTYTAEELGGPATAPAPRGRRTPQAAIAEVRRARRVLGDRDLPVSTVFFGGGTPTLLPAARPGGGGGRDRRRVRAGARRRGHDRVQPRQRHPGRPRGAAGRRHQPDLVRHAVRGRRTCCARWTAPTTRGGCPTWSRGRGAAGFDAGQPGPDLRHARGSRSPTGRPRSTRRWPAQPDHVSAYSLIVEDGTALARQVRRGEVPMPDDDDLADKYLLADERLARRRPGVVRGVELGARRGQPLPPQPALLDRRRLVGRRSRRALPRRRRALVERQAPRGVRRPAGRRPQPRPRARGARRGEPARRAGAAGGAAARRARPRRAGRRPGARRCPASWPTGCWCPRTDRWCSPGAAGCSPTPWSATCCREPALS